MSTITMREIMQHTGALRETIRVKIRSKKIPCLGIEGAGRNKTSLYNKQDVQFILDMDFSNYKKDKTISKEGMNHPLNNAGITALLKTTRLGAVKQ